MYKCNKPPKINSRSRFNQFLLGSVTVSALLVNSVPSFAASQADADAIALSCASAINVMACIQETQGSPVQQQSGSNVVGMAKSMATQQATQAVTGVANSLSGPVSIGIRYDSDLSWIADLGYSHQIGNFAAALKASVGMNELRGNATVGYALTSNQQVKLTYEYLRQNLPFEFTAGNVNEWVSQQALGASYRYVFNKSWLQSLEVYGTYAKANSKELSDAYINDANGDLDTINQRRIAGGTEKNAGANVTFLPFKTTSVKVGAGYSSLSFDHKDGYTATGGSGSQNNSTIAYNAEINHIIGDKTMISTSVSNTASARSHTAKVSQILPGNLEASVVGQYNFSHTTMADNGSVTANLSYPAPKSYSAAFASSLGDLKNWVETPVVHYSRVLAIAEERLIAAKITTNPIPDQSVTVGQQLSPIQTSQYFTFSKEAYDNINYNVVSIVDKNDPNKHYSTSDLGLKINKVDNYNATVASAAPMPTNALAANPGPSGQYVLTLEAEGVRKGAVISRVDNTANISVSQDGSLAFDKWSDNNTLPPAYLTKSYGPQSMKAYIVNKSGIKDDVYTYTPNGLPSGLKIDDNGNLTGTPTAEGSFSFTLKAVSKATGKSVQTDPGTFNIAVANENAPIWKDCSLPAIPVGQNITNGDISTCVKANQTITFAIGTNPPPSSTGWTIDSTKGILSGTPNDVSQVGQSINVPVVATTVDGGSVTGMVTIPINKGIFAAPTGTSRAATPNAVKGSTTYGSEPLANFFSTNPNLVKDNYAYTADTKDCDNKNLKLKLSDTTDNADQNQKVKLILDGNGPIPDPMSCLVNITATSQASSGPGNATVTINVQQNGIIWLNKSLDQLTYLVAPASPYATINSDFVVAQGDGLSISGVQAIGTLPSYLTSQADGVSLVLTADTGESQIDKVDATCQANNVNLRATASDQSTADKSFTACLMPNANLTQPQWKGSVQIQTLTNQDVPHVSMNPTVNSPNADTNTYVAKTKTQDGTADVADQYSNFQMGTMSGVCGTLSIASDGYLQGKISNEGTCTFNFTMYSKAMGKTIPTAIQGKISATNPPAPMWKDSAPTPQNITLAQGSDNGVNGFNITDNIDPNSNSMNDFDVKVINGTEGSDLTPSKWSVYKDPSTLKFYIIRTPSKQVCTNAGVTLDGCYDAADLGTTTPFNVKLAFFPKGSTTYVGNPVDYKFTVLTDSKAQFRFVGKVDLKATVGSTTNITQLITDNKNDGTLNQLKSWIGNSMIVHDTILMDSYNTTLGSPVGSPNAITYSANGNTKRTAMVIRNTTDGAVAADQYSLFIKPTDVEMDNIYTPDVYIISTFNGVKSKVITTSQTVKVDSTQGSGFRVNIYANAKWSGTTLSDKNIEVAPDNTDSSRKEGRNFIQLDQLFSNPNGEPMKVAGLTITCKYDGDEYSWDPATNSCGFFTIVNADPNTGFNTVNGHWYLMRKKFKQGTYTGYEARDMNQAYGNTALWGYKTLVLSVSYTEYPAGTQTPPSDAKMKINIYPYEGTVYKPRWDAGVGVRTYSATGGPTKPIPNKMAGDPKTEGLGSKVPLAGAWNINNYIKTCDGASGDTNSCGTTFIFDYTYVANIEDTNAGGLARYVMLSPSYNENGTSADRFPGNNRQMYIGRYTNGVNLTNGFNYDTSFSICTNGKGNTNEVESACGTNQTGSVDGITTKQGYRVTVAYVRSSALPDRINQSWSTNMVTSPAIAASPWLNITN